MDRQHLPSRCISISSDLLLRRNWSSRILERRSALLVLPVRLPAAGDLAATDLLAEYLLQMWITRLRTCQSLAQYLSSKLNIEHIYGCILQNMKARKTGILVYVTGLAFTICKSTRYFQFHNTAIHSYSQLFTAIVLQKAHRKLTANCDTPLNGVAWIYMYQ